MYLAEDILWLDWGKAEKRPICHSLPRTGALSQLRSGGITQDDDEALRELRTVGTCGDSASGE